MIWLISKFLFLFLLNISSFLQKELEFLTEIGSHGHFYLPHLSKYKHILDTNEAIEDNSIRNITPLGIK